MKTVKTALLVLVLVGTLAQADMKECEFRLSMGKSTEKVAVKLYEQGNYVDSLHKFKMARSNYIIGFKHCLNTPKEDELINRSEAVSKIINNKSFRNITNIQKILRNSK